MYNGILFSHKKEGNLVIWNNMNGLPGDYMLSEITQAKERQILYDLIYM